MRFPRTPYAIGVPPASAVAGRLPAVVAVGRLGVAPGHR